MWVAPNNPKKVGSSQLLPQLRDRVAQQRVSRAKYAHEKSGKRNRGKSATSVLFMTATPRPAQVAAAGGNRRLMLAARVAHLSTSTTTKEDADAKPANVEDRQEAATPASAAPFSPLPANSQSVVAPAKAESLGARLRRALGFKVCIIEALNTPNPVHYAAPSTSSACAACKRCGVVCPPFPALSRRPTLHLHVNQLPYASHLMQISQPSNHARGEPVKPAKPKGLLARFSRRWRVRCGLAQRHAAAASRAQGRCRPRCFELSMR